MNDSIGIELLGPVQLRVHGSEALAGPPLQRAVLGYLAVHAGKPVPRDELIDAVWGESAPHTVAGNLHTYVSKLRRRIAEAAPGSHTSPVRTSGSGYCLDIAAHNIDINQFDRDLRQAHEHARKHATTAAVRCWQRALRRWHGTPFSGSTSPYALVERTRLRNLRVAAISDLVDTLLESGTITDTLTALDTLDNALESYPLHQRFVEQRIRALHNRGRRADALAQFDHTTRVLAEQLGIDPDARLLAARERVLASSPPARPHVIASQGTIRAHGRGSPPPLPSTFTGRATELGSLEQLTTQHASVAPTVVTVDGMPGVGKTALALTFAHRMTHRYPDGCHYLDFRGKDPTDSGLPVREALSSLIRAVGGDSLTVPTDFDECVGLYRSLLAGRRTLIILDDVRHVEQIRALLPASSGATVLVTSRYRLQGLAARNGSSRLTLRQLPHHEARELLLRSLGTVTPVRSHIALSELACLCGHLPLALRRACEQLTNGTATGIEELVGRLRDERVRISGLAAGPTDARTEEVDAAFESALRVLSREDALLFTLLGTQPSCVITVPSAATLTGWTVPRTRRVLDSLAMASLLDWGTRHSYHINPLLHAYAVRLRTTDPTVAVLV